MIIPITFIQVHILIILDFIIVNFLHFDNKKIAEDRKIVNVSRILQDALGLNLLPKTTKGKMCIKNKQGAQKSEFNINKGIVKKYDVKKIYLIGG